MGKDSTKQFYRILFTLKGGKFFTVKEELSEQIARSKFNEENPLCSIYRVDKLNK